MKSTLRKFAFVIVLLSLSGFSEGALLSKLYVSLHSIIGEKINITSTSEANGSGSYAIEAKTNTECASKCAVNPQCTVFRFEGREQNEETPLCRTGPNLGSPGDLLDADLWDTFLQVELAAGQECLVSQQCGKPFRSPLAMTCDPATHKCTCSNASSYEPPAIASSDLKMCIPCGGPDSLGFRHLWDGFSYVRLPQMSGMLNRSQAQAACKAVNASTLPEPSPANDVNFQSLAAFMGPNDVFHLGYSVTEGPSGRQYVSDSTNASMALESSSVWPPVSSLGPSGNLRSVLMNRTGLQIGPDGVEITCVLCWKRTGYSFLNLTGLYYKMYAQNMSYYDGGTLAVTNRGYGKTLIGHFQNVSGVMEFWIGGTDEAHEGTWVFPDGTTLYKPDNSTTCVPAAMDPHWHSEDPNGGTRSNCIRPVEGCVWRDIACSYMLPFLCERMF